jgi:hypothetical protein
MKDLPASNRVVAYVYVILAYAVLAGTVFGTDEFVSRGQHVILYGILAFVFYIPANCLLFLYAPNTMKRTSRGLIWVGSAALLLALGLSVFAGWASVTAPSMPLDARFAAAYNARALIHRWHIGFLLLAGLLVPGIDRAVFGKQVGAKEFLVSLGVHVLLAAWLLVTVFLIGLFLLFTW